MRVNVMLEKMEVGHFILKRNLRVMRPKKKVDRINPNHLIEMI
jgi:hypothetical protein